MPDLKSYIKKLLNEFSSRCTPLRYHLTRRRFPVHLTMGAEEAEATLSQIYPDNGESCLCHNNIDPKHDLHIIVPVYNVEAYLTECLDSIFNQETNYSFFVSLIDDGSTDRSGEILDTYVGQLDKNIYDGRVEVIHQKNGGLSAARNRALENIRGRYVMFIDSDDRLTPTAVESLLTAAIESGADIAEGCFQNGSSHGFAWGKVYHAELFGNVRFPRGYWFEDTVNIFFLYPVSRKMISVPGIHYYYRPTPGSIMNSLGNNPKVMDSIWVSRRVLNDYFSSGHHATEQLFHDFLLDIYSSVSHLSKLGDERAMQAMFVIECRMAKEHFMSCLLDNTKHTLPLHLRQLADALHEENYRKFRSLPTLR